MLSRGASGLGVGVGAQNGAVSFFSILEFNKIATAFSFTIYFAFSITRFGWRRLAAAGVIPRMSNLGA